MAINTDLKAHLNGTGGAGLFGSKSSEWALGDIIDAMHTELGGDVVGTTISAPAITVTDPTGDLSVGGLVASDPSASTAITGTTETNTNFDNTFTIPANSLRVGDKVRIEARGLYTAATGTETHIFNVMLGSTSIAATGNIDPAANDMWSIDFTFEVRAIGAGGTVVGTGLCVSGPRATAAPAIHRLATGATSTSTTAVDTTTALVAAIAVDRQTTATDSDSMRMDSFTVEVIPAP